MPLMFDICPACGYKHGVVKTINPSKKSIKSKQKLYPANIELPQTNNIHAIFSEIDIIKNPKKSILKNS